MQEKQSTENDKPAEIEHDNLRWVIRIWRLVNSCILLVGFFTPWWATGMLAERSGTFYLGLIVYSIGELEHWRGSFIWSEVLWSLGIAVPILGLFYYILSNAALGLNVKYMTKHRGLVLVSLIISSMSIGLLVGILLFTNAALGAWLTCGGLVLSIVLEITDSKYRRVIKPKKIPTNNEGLESPVTDVERPSPDGPLLRKNATRHWKIIGLTSALVIGATIVAFNIFGKGLAEPTVIFAGHTAPIRQLAWSPDGTRIATASDDSTARVWEATTGVELTILASHTENVDYIAWSPDSKRIVTHAWDQSARIWDAASGEELALFGGPENLVMYAILSPDGASILVTTFLGDTMRVWDWAENTEIIEFKINTPQVVRPFWSPDGTRILIFGSSVRVWDLVSGAELASLTLPTPLDRFSDANWSPDGTRIVIAGGDMAAVWGVNTGDELLLLTGHVDDIGHVAWSPDGTRIVTASYDGTARVWDAISGAQLTVFRRHTKWVLYAAWSPDGTRIVTTSDDGTARVWDPTSGAQLAVFNGDTWSGDGSAAWSPNGLRIVTAGADGIARVWDVPSSK